jgi:hypothetical protein
VETGFRSYFTGRGLKEHTVHIRNLGSNNSKWFRIETETQILKDGSCFLVSLVKQLNVFRTQNKQLLIFFVFVYSYNMAAAALSITSLHYQFIISTCQDREVSLHVPVFYKKEKNFLERFPKSSYLTATFRTNLDPLSWEEGNSIQPLNKTRVPTVNKEWQVWIVKSSICLRHSDEIRQLVWDHKIEWILVRHQFFAVHLSSASS